MKTILDEESEFDWRTSDGIKTSDGKIIREPKVTGETQLDRKRRLNKAWRRRHRESLNVYSAKWKKANPQKAKRYSRTCYVNIRTERLEQIREYKQRNKSAVKLRQKIYDARPERRLARRIFFKRWKTENPEKYKAHLKASRARRKHAEVHPKTSEIIGRWLREKCFVCYYCLERFPTSNLHIDHIIPLSRGGKHTPENICRSCPSCNCQKYTTFISDLKLSQPLLGI